MKKVDHRKTIMEGCVLEALRQQSTNPYQVKKYLEMFGFEGIREQSVYMIIRRLFEQGCLTKIDKNTNTKSKSHMYTLTTKGLQTLTHFRATWLQQVKSVELLFEGF